MRNIHAQRPLPLLPTCSLPPTLLVHHVDKGPPTHPIPQAHNWSR